MYHCRKSHKFYKMFQYFMVAKHLKFSVYNLTNFFKFKILKKKLEIEYYLFMIFYL